jgi:hypothetical protein
MGWKIGSPFPIGARDLNQLHIVLTGSGVNPAFFPMGTDGYFLKVKAVGA